jgi:pimeloyl-ACP methyl ester carboxylesterase
VRCFLMNVASQPSAAYARKARSSVHDRLSEPPRRRPPGAYRVASSWKASPNSIEAHRFMAERAQACDVVEIGGASHAVGVSHPEEVADVILRAIKAVE